MAVPKYNLGTRMQIDREQGTKPPSVAPQAWRLCFADQDMASGLSGRNTLSIDALQHWRSFRTITVGTLAFWTRHTHSIARADASENSTGGVQKLDGVGVSFTRNVADTVANGQPQPSQYDRRFRSCCSSRFFRCLHGVCFVGDCLSCFFI